MLTLTINQSNFLKGISLTDNFNNGGFSPNSVGFEVDRGANLGILLPGRDATSCSTTGIVTLSGNVITSVTNPNLGIYCLATSNGNVYSTVVYPVAHTLQDSSIGTPTHSIMYKGGLYIITTGDIYYDDFTFTIKNKTWWTVTKGKTALTLTVPHKAFEFQGVMYITNGNKIASWDGTTATDAAFTLPTGWVITDAIVDNDIIHIAASYLFANSNSNYNPKTKIFDWNTFTSTTWQGEYNVYTGVITSMVKSNKGFILFSGDSMYSLNLSYGTAICDWIINLSTTPNYNQVCLYNGNIYFSFNFSASGKGVACYNTRFGILTYPYYFVDHPITSINIGYLDYIDIFSESSGMYRGSVNNRGGAFFSNRYDLQNGLIRKIIIGFSSALATNSTYTLDIYDETGTSAYNKVISRAVHGAVSVVTLNNISHPNPINLMQLRLVFGNAANSGIRFIKIFYEPSEKYVSR